eukprot:CAMPEP_0197662292 /NCGR_PEP_ID=MMETSP1338-20131121/52807_1 /TAXON_ID=43686 ORGANISM="Pelagodinium beii, Strain RCC1491" /NCGR_SAMPLE_ID=MMETSP1338 /ASSEMBLY_ACC=CAM_ASM_000754 /LENGTH=339 /DNA_ID=CAMNT_0043240069 /DNA_START=67 /DNA_END=1086 /DNA_ORIENTATION=-
MGKKEPVKEDKEEEEETAEPEDPPVVKELKEIDDKYLAIEREYEQELNILMLKFTKQQEPLLQQRSQMLMDKAKAESEEDKSFGTPACKDFWLQAMKNLPALEDLIEEWDEEVLMYCCDVQKSFLDDADPSKGFKLSFVFVENPFFTNEVLWKEFHLEEDSPYTGEQNCTKIQACEIDWKPGKDVTVERVQKKTKGGGAKKAKQKGKVNEEPRESFFREFFKTLIAGDKQSLEEVRDNPEMDMDDEDADAEEMLEMIMDNQRDIGDSVKNHLIPFAVRWYTGEAAPDDFDEDDEEEDDEDDEEEDVDDDEDDEPPKRAAAKKKGGKPAGAGEKEECKQQ